MANTITLSRQGLAASEATILRWLKQVGDPVDRGEPLVEVRAGTEVIRIPSPAPGVVKKLVAGEGETVEVGEALAVLSGGNDGEGAPNPPAYVPAGDEEIVPLGSVQTRLAEHMVRSVHASPHVTTLIAVDMTEADALRRRYADRVRQRHGLSLTFLPFVAKYVAESLARFPSLNAQLVGAAVHRKRYVHLAVAVPGDAETPVAPVIRDADKKGVLTIAREIADFERRAREGRLTAGALRGATFALAHPGASGALVQTPIIHQPHAATLSVGAVTQTPAVAADQIVVRSLLHLCLSHDARIVDGDTAARFLSDIKQSLEEIRFLFV